MYKSLSNIGKAILSVAVSPIALVVDIVRLPVSAYNVTDPLENSKAMLCQAGRLVKETVGIKDDKNNT